MAGTLDEFEHTFLASLEHRNFPCVGAKAAHARQAIEFFLAGDIESKADDAAVTRRIQHFACSKNSDAMFVSLVVGFVRSRPMDEIDFEAALWERLQGIHAVDRSEYDWDPAVSHDPQSPRFSISVGGKAFYIIGLHPNSSRMARRFDCAALVFNLHSQFDQLRIDGRYGQMAKAIGTRDLALSGSVNPMLATHGESSEARQYSGRALNEDWICPFRAGQIVKSDAA